eukprot:jgi/Ulvmu1/2121/UM127_0006.1
MLGGSTRRDSEAPHLGYAICIPSVTTPPAPTTPDGSVPPAGPHPEFVNNDFIGEQGPVSLGTNPMLGALTTGFKQAIFNFAPCSVIFPHSHPRGDENMIVLEGTIDTGFIDEAGTLIRDQAVPPTPPVSSPRLQVAAATSKISVDPVCEARRAGGMGSNGQ